MAIDPLHSLPPAQWGFEAITRNIYRHTFQVSGIPFILNCNVQQVRTHSSHCWHSLNRLRHLPAAIDRIMRFGERLKCSEFKEDPEVKLFLENRRCMKTECRASLDCITVITAGQESRLISHYTPLILRYLQTRNGNDLIIAQDKHLEISSTIRTHHNTLRACSKALKYIHPKNAEIKSAGEQQLQVIDAHLSYGDPIAQALFRLERATASNSSSQDLNTSNKLMIDWGIHTLQCELHDINPELIDQKHRYDNLSHLYELVQEAAKQLGFQILKAGNCDDEDLIMEMLYSIIGTPNVEGDPIEWMKRDFHYYLSKLRLTLSERQMRKTFG